ncbi:MAG: hypothetical protein AAF927_13560 [Bacteroidota bacterium]
MKLFNFPIILFSFCLLFLGACGESAPQTPEEEFIAIETLDSNLMTNDEPAHFANPDLIGNWKQIDMRMDGKSYFENLEQTTVTFAENGEITYLSEGLPPRKGEFMQVKQILSAPEIWEADLNVKTLTATKLVLSEEVSGQMVEYHYEKL